MSGFGLDGKRPDDAMWIRRALHGDAVHVANLIAALLAELSEGDNADPATILPAVSHALARPDYLILLSGQTELPPAAVITVEPGFAVYAGGPIGTIRELYVQPALRSSGCGAALVQAAADHGARTGWRRLEVTLPAGPRWARTRAFYSAIGFAEAGPKLRRLI